MKALRRFEAALARAERFLVCALLALLAALAFLQVVLRQVGFGFVWADTLLRHLVLWVGFLGAAAAAGEERHFAIDALARRLPPPAPAGLARAGRAVGAAASAALAWAALQFVRAEAAAGTTLFSIGRVSFPAAWFQAVLPLAFALMAFHFAMRLGDPPKEHQS